MSPRRYAGWEPVVVHEHYGADGSLTGTTVVSREAEWDEQSRALAEGLEHLDETTCSRCSGDLSVTLVHKEPYDVDTDTVCYSCRAQAVMERFDAHRHEAADKAAGPGTPRHGDGRIYPVRPITMEELDG